MKTCFHLFVAASLIALAAVASAQTPAAVVNSIAVKRLIAAGTPDAHRALAGHFAALADTYAADADRDSAFARAFIGNPNRTFGMGIGAQYARVAKIASEWSAAAREVARYHEEQAAGHTAASPARLAFFNSGGGAPAPTAEELRALAASARTGADHYDLEEYYLTVARTNEAWADRHLAMAQALRANANQRGLNDRASHCDRIARDARATAKQARADAATQHQLATVA